jgi:DNA-binding LacI/PurR family transcriptional regulator
MEGFKDTLLLAGFPIDPDFIMTNPIYDIDLFDTLLDEWLEKLSNARKLPTAIFACDYTMTLATLGALRRRYIVVPNDISLIGFDDPLSASHLSPPLTTIRQPAYNIGVRAAQRLMNALFDTEISETIYGTEYIETEVIIRRSTCPPRVSS